MVADIREEIDGQGLEGIIGTGGWMGGGVGE